MRSTCVAGRLAYNYAVRMMNDSDSYTNPMDARKAWSAERDLIHPWMSTEKIPAAPVNDVININFKNALANWKRSGYSGDKVPRFKKRSAPLSISMSYITIADRHINGVHVKLPSKMGTARLAEPLRFSGKLKSTTFSYRGGKWYASFLIESDINQYDSSAVEHNPIGVDVGIVNHATLSNGEHINIDEKNIKYKITKCQRKLSRMEKGSKNWWKQVAKLVKLKAKESYIRKNSIEHISRQLADNYNPIVVEDLNISGMTASAKGTTEAPGKNVKAKSGLNRELLNKSLGALRVKIEYKAARRGSQVIAVNPAYTSRTCPACGHESKDNRKTQEKFCCVACGHSGNADIIGAQNILARGIV
jgi:putative transposase